VLNTSRKFNVFLPQKMASGMESLSYRWKQFRKLPKRMLAAADYWLACCCSRSSLLSAVYYVCFNSAFRREQQAVLAGRVRYRQEIKSPTESSALLRRNTHRLEKGLLMRPRNDIFALDYIDETVSSYERAIASSLKQRLQPSGVDLQDEIGWAHDVIKEYFTVTKDHPRTRTIRKRFASLESPASPELDPGAKRIPYRRDLSKKPSVSYDALLQLAKRRRTVRWFLDRSVPRPAVDRAIEIAAQSPSACNRQPFCFRVIDDPSLLRQVAGLPMGTAGYAKNIPMMIVIVGRLRNYTDERDRHLIYIDGSLAAMSLIFALEVQELSSCCINWPDIESKEKAMAKLLQLAPDERPIMCLAVGYADPDAMVACSTKKPLRQLRRFNLDRAA
jgi:nitroreductase